MKRLILLSLLILPFISSATVFNVEAGGNQNVTPYYSPQVLTIELGDTVIWDFVLGQHNVTTTSAPVEIASGNISSPGTFQYIFEVAGVYEYECTLFNHADTQFGTITVNGPDGIMESELQGNTIVYPNPCVDELWIDFSTEALVEYISIMDVCGKTFGDMHWNANAKTIQVGHLPSGLYLVEVHTDKGVIRKRFQVIK